MLFQRMTDKVVSEANGSNAAVYPHYGEIYRGLPREIRLMIWRYAFGHELEVKPSMSAEAHTSQEALTTCPFSQVERWGK